MSDDPSLADRLADDADWIRTLMPIEVEPDQQYAKDRLMTLAFRLDEAVEALREKDRLQERWDTMGTILNTTDPGGETRMLVEVMTLLADADLPCKNPIPVIDGLTRQHRKGRCGKCANCKLNELRGTDE